MELNTPYGGGLVDLMARGKEREALLAEANTLPSLQLSDRSVHDLELLAVGAFSPLRGFMGQADYEGVLREMRLTDGTLWPVPITLPVADDAPVQPGASVALRNSKNDLLAVMRVAEVYPWDYEREATVMAGKPDPRHPLVAEMAGWGKRYAAGPLRVLNLPQYYDFAELRLTPAQVHARLLEMGSSQVVAFQTRNPLHRSHEELTKRAAAAVGGSLGFLAYRILQRTEAAERQLASLSVQSDEASALARQAMERAVAADANARAAAEGRQVAEVRAAGARGEADAARLEASTARETAARAEAEADRIRKSAVAERNRLEAALGQIAETRRTALGLVMNLGGDHLKFEFNRAELSVKDRELLSRIAGILMTAHD